MPQRVAKSLSRARIYRYPDLRPAGVPYTRKHVTHLEKQDEFPMHVELGPNSVGWVAEEVDAWVEERIRRRDVRRAAPAAAARPRPTRKATAPPPQRGHQAAQ
jgi:prophage regulatory protein